MKYLLSFIIFLLAPVCILAQRESVELPQYSFVKYKENKLHFDTSSSSMKTFFWKWQRMIDSQQGNINIVHIGGSHVQAGTMSNTIRTNLMHAYPSLVAGRGMIFPYSAAARCNNPH